MATAIACQLVIYKGGAASAALLDSSPSGQPQDGHHIIKASV
jgi:hypothetical protein